MQNPLSAIPQKITVITLIWIYTLQPTWIQWSWKQMKSSCNTCHSIVPLDSFKLIRMASQEATFLNYYSHSSKHLSPKAESLVRRMCSQLSIQHHKVSMIESKEHCTSRGSLQFHCTTY